METLNQQEKNQANVDSPEPDPISISQHLNEFDLNSRSSPQKMNAEYQRRLSISVGFSFLLNLLILWILLNFSITPFPWLSHKPKIKPHKESSRLVLIPNPTRPKARTFLETDPQQAVHEKPKEADFYSEHNTAATQILESPQNSFEIPKLDGQNTKTMATETVHPSPTSPPPSSPPENQASQTPKEPSPPVPEKKQSNPSPKGDYAMVKMTPQVPVKKQDPVDPAKSTPPSPQQPPSQNQSAQSSFKEVPTSMSKLAGGVPRTGKAMAFNSAESPFASYDKKIIGKIGGYWQYQVVDKFYGEKVGEVEISFKLLETGRVTDLKIERNTANAILAGWCLQAIEKSSPFEPFPESMKAMVGDHREGTVTFAY